MPAIDSRMNYCDSLVALLRSGILYLLSASAVVLLTCASDACSATPNFLNHSHGTKFGDSAIDFATSEPLALHLVAGEGETTRYLIFENRESIAHNLIRLAGKLYPRKKWRNVADGRPLSVSSVISVANCSNRDCIASIALRFQVGSALPVRQLSENASDRALSSAAIMHFDAVCALLRCSPLARCELFDCAVILFFEYCFQLLLQLQIFQTSEGNKDQSCFVDMHQSGAFDIQDLCSMSERHPQHASLRMSVEVRATPPLESCSEVLQAFVLHPFDPVLVARSDPFNATVLLPYDRQALLGITNSAHRPASSTLGHISCACKIATSNPWSRQFLGSVFIVRFFVLYCLPQDLTSSCMYRLISHSASGSLRLVAD
jgi:hypothetical protein